MSGVPTTVGAAQYNALLRNHERLRMAILDALASAEEEGVHRHRGTDDPREFVKILRAGLDPAPAPTGGDAR